MNRKKINQLQLFLLFSITIFVKLMWLHRKFFSMEGFFIDPENFIYLLLPKIACALTIASLLFLIKNYRWTIVVSFIIDFWIIANIIYIRANGFWINSNAILMADNMNGFWSSIIIFFTWKEIIPFVISGLYMIFLSAFGVDMKRNNISFILVFVLSFLMRSTANYYNYYGYINAKSIRNAGTIESYSQIYRPVYDPFFGAYHAAYCYHCFTPGLSCNWEEKFVFQNSIIDFALADISYGIYDKYFSCINEKNKLKVPFSQEEQKKIELIEHKDSCRSFQPESNLIVILFESLEGWVFEDFSQSETIVPNLRKLSRNSHSLFAPCVESQVLQGNSGDGQMIILTGLLPVRFGAACCLYGSNYYPNYAHFFKNSEIINPSPGAWNQGVVTSSYGFDRLIDIPENDSVIVDALLREVDKSKSPSFYLAITMASHSPFPINGYKIPELSPDMPSVLRDYITCINFTDEAIGRIIDMIETDNKWKNSTLVIIGDHTVFRKPMLDQFHDYACLENLSIKEKVNYVPLIIYSPKIETNVTISEICYQMDVYPTIMSLIGCRNHYWKGFGKDLLSQDENRILEVDECFSLSDKLIRNDYFSKYREIDRTEKCKMH